MEKRKQVRRVTPRKAAVQRYQLFAPVKASDSPNSMAMPTQSDLRLLVGLQKADEVRIERLIGFGLLPENTAVPARGYL